MSAAGNLKQLNVDDAEVLQEIVAGCEKVFLHCDSNENVFIVGLLECSVSITSVSPPQKAQVRKSGFCTQQVFCFYLN